MFKIACLLVLVLIGYVRGMNSSESVDVPADIAAVLIKKVELNEEQMKNLPRVNSSSPRENADANKSKDIDVLYQWLKFLRSDNATESKTDDRAPLSTTTSQTEGKPMLIEN